MQGGLDYHVASVLRRGTKALFLAGAVVRANLIPKMLYPALPWPFCSALLTSATQMEFIVFDDAGGEDPLRCIIGVAFVPLAGLAQGVPVEGAFRWAACPRN